MLLQCGFCVACFALRSALQSVSAALQLASAALQLASAALQLASLALQLASSAWPSNNKVVHESTFADAQHLLYMIPSHS